MADAEVKTPNYPARVAARAADVDLVKLLLSVLALPFYIVGLVFGLLWLAVRWCYAAVLVGYSDLTKRGTDAG